MVRLSAPILTGHQIPAFTGSIEVNITAEDLPSGDPRHNALFGKCLSVQYICAIVHSVAYNFVHYNRHNYNTEWTKFHTHILINIPACM